jgi:uncharacterized protein (DUF983 family)
MLVDLLRLRCPRCRQGRMFRGLFAMNDPCPVCGMIYQREEGYFLGAMYVSYVIGCAILIPFYYLVGALLPGWSAPAVIAVAFVPYLVLTPFVFQYSRAVWVYFERTVDPSDVNATVYEKVRRQELDSGSGHPH